MTYARGKHGRAAVMVPAILMILTAAIAAPAQTYTTLASFGGPNGEFPYSTLVQGTDGNLYGTTVGPGLSGGIGGGTVYRLTPSGTLTTVYRFCPKSQGGANCPNGYQPYGRLVLEARMRISTARRPEAELMAMERYLRSPEVES
jgi:uncharacterized repeat protein (TIGR03803 family)